MLKKLLARGGIAAVFLVAALQLLPYGRTHTNPPVTKEAPWPSQRARAAAEQSCYSCHSNETHWPWYSHIAPMSWLVQHDVDSAREVLNFSEWDQEQEGGHDAGEVVADGSMPPARYTLVNPAAKLSDADKQVLIRALEAFEGGGGEGNSGPGGGDSGGPRGGGDDSGPG